MFRFCCLIVVAASVNTAAYGQIGVIGGSATAAFDSFGSAVAVDGNSTDGWVIAVGAPRADTAVTNGGAVDIYRDSGGGPVFETRLHASDAAAEDRFGTSVELLRLPTGEELLVVAAEDAPIVFGKVYVFRFNGTSWIEEAILEAPPGFSGGQFGSSLALNGTRLVVGDRLALATTTNAGAAYVFDYNGIDWAFQEKLVPPDEVNGDFFGDAVTLEGDVVCVGAPRDGEACGGSFCGSVYVFERDPGTGDWALLQELTLSNPEPAEDFGVALALSGDSLLIGAPGRDVPAAGVPDGVIVEFAFLGGSWVNTQQVIVPAPLPGASSQANFGVSLERRGDVLVVGAPLDYGCGFGCQSGSVRLFSLVAGDWVEQPVFPGPVAQSGDELGASVALAEGLVVAGAPERDTSFGNASGVAYSFDPSESGGPQFIRGDANGDGDVSVADTVRILGFLFQMMPIECLLAGDVNDDNDTDVADTVLLLQYLFVLGSPPPPSPFPDCGFDPTGSFLECGANSCP